MKINIPILFEFSVTKLLWASHRARITGWWRQDDGTLDPNNLCAAIESEKKIFQFRSSALTFEEQMQCERIPVGEKYNKEIETICSAVQVPVLISSISRNTATHERHSSTADPLGEALEMIALRAQSTTFPNFLLKWRQRNTEKVVRAPNHRSSMYKHPPDPDPWQMRKEFLRLRPDRKSVLEFLTKWGNWNSEEVVQLDEIISFQERVRETLTLDSGGWLGNEFLCLYPADPVSQIPALTIRTDECQRAIHMTVTIDMIRNTKFKICARPDCSEIFQVKSKHKQKYHSQYCGHLESMRRTRKQKSS
jgi:hypothetical protein